jgi:hypothetical protein
MPAQGGPTSATPSRFTDEVYETLEERGVKYAIRIPANDSLERDIGELPTRPVGRPSHKPVVWYLNPARSGLAGMRRRPCS